MENFEFVPGGGVTTPAGFLASAVAAGFKAGSSRDDLALVVSDTPAAAAGVFTQNVFAAPPVVFCREQFAAQTGASFGQGRAVVINSGCANAATGSAGMQVCATEARVAADALGCAADEVLVASTGVIGVLPDVARFESGIPAAAAALSAGAGADAARAIMTTDTRPKEFAVKIPADALFGEGAPDGFQDISRVVAQNSSQAPRPASRDNANDPAWTAQTTAQGKNNFSQRKAYEGSVSIADTHDPDAALKPAEPTFPANFYIGGMAKGSGMIMPDMATMIAVITTDVPVAPAALYSALSAAVGRSFNKITVDSDTSTNDTCIAFANGTVHYAHALAAAGVCELDESSPAYPVFESALTQVCQALAREMARDGEGATKLVTVNVSGAATDADADAAARTVANSPLVKTAIAGHDANWGRIAAALGRSGAVFNAQDVDIDIMGIPVCRAGFAQPFDEALALARFNEPEVAIDINLGAGECNTTIWTCDLTHDYISINADYRS